MRNKYSVTFSKKNKLAKRITNFIELSFLLLSSPPFFFEISCAVVVVRHYPPTRDGDKKKKIKKG